MNYENTLINIIILIINYVIIINLIFNLIIILIINLIIIYFNILSPTKCLLTYCRQKYETLTKFANFLRIFNKLCTFITIYSDTYTNTSYIVLFLL